MIGESTGGGGASTTAEATAARTDWVAELLLDLTKAGACGLRTVVPAFNPVLNAAFARLVCKAGPLAADNRPCMFRNAGLA